MKADRTETSTDRSSNRPLRLVLVWLAANYGYHAVFYLFTGQPYLALAPLQAALAELGLMALNLGLPLIALAAARPRPASLRDALAWRWRGWRTAAGGLLGFGLIALSAPLVNRVVGAPPFAYGGGFGPITSAQGWMRAFALLALLLALWLVSTLGEEIMFRSYLQTGFGQRFGPLAGLLIAALLFALRHTPADLYWGRGAPPQQWASRLLQLALAALVLGWVRHRSGSTIATWIAHLVLWIAVVFQLMP
jgi:membrane protease YdiL (CAAX protease family)